MNKNITQFTNLNSWLKFRGSINGTLGFVPTMGALHQGHLSLVEKSLSQNDFTLVSIFINPTQFNDPKDFEKYPQTLEEDIKRLEKVGCQYVITPNFNQLYPDNYKFQISENELSLKLCGKSRPGHFSGVLTIVMKLLNIAQAQKAYFGKKDYQQYLLIKNMAEAFFLKTEIVGCETVREEDGLAMSSRNLLLNVEQRKVAPQFFKHLLTERNIEDVKNELEKEDFRIDYIEEEFGRRFAAVYLGDVRLIDNVKMK